MGTKGNNNVVKCKVNFALEKAIKAQREREREREIVEV